MVVLSNYNKTHAFTNFIPNMNTIGGLTLRPVLNTIVSDGSITTITIDLELEEAEGNLNSLHGVAFTLDYGTWGSSATLNGSNSFLGTEGLNLFVIEQDFAGSSIEGAFTKNDGIDAQIQPYETVLLGQLMIQGNNTGGTGFNVLELDFLEIYIIDQEVNEIAQETETTNVFFPEDGMGNLMTASITATASDCAAAATATIAVSGGTAPYTYTWIGGQTTPSITDLLPGTYQVSISDATHTEIAAYITVEGFEPITSTITSNIDIDMDGNMDDASVTATGGSGGLSYEWETGETGMTATNLSSGTYNLTITDNAGCEKVETFTVGALATHLLDFTASPEEQVIQLNWVTSNEENMLHYEVQRSTNQQYFEKIGQQTAFNKSAATYHFEDNTVEPNTLYYYRLKMVEQNGSFDYSDIVSAQINGKENNIQLFPNPATEQCHLVFETPLKNAVDLTIFNALGQIQEQLTTTENQIQLDLKTWATGIYYIQVTQNQQSQILRLVKE